MSNDRFKMPKPAFIAPSKPLIPTDGSFKRDTTPGVSISVRAPLPTLNLPTFGSQLPKEKKTRTKVEKQEVPVAKPALAKFGPEHVCSDAEFIVRTRAFTIHDPEMKELFFANGGEDIYDGYETLAQAFDSLRRQKQARLTQIAGSEVGEYRRFQPKNENEMVYVPGLVAHAEAARERAKEAARFRAENENWIRQPIERRTA